MRILRDFARVLLVAAVAAEGGAAVARQFPDHPLRLVIPYAPGGGTDNLVRVIAPVAGEYLGQIIVIENKPGAATFIGMEDVARAPADGYTMLATDSAILVNPGLFKSKMPFDTLKTFTGVSMMAAAPVVLVENLSVPAKTLQDVIALAKAKPGALNYASGGYGTSTHLAGEMFKLRTGTDITHVAYKGSAPAMTDVLGGHVEFNFAGISTAGEYIKSGKLRALAQTGKERSPALPEVPTFEEAGVPGVDADTYWGIYARTGSPPEALAIVSAAFAKALRDPRVSKRLAELGYRVIGNTPEQHTQQFHEAIARWTEVVDKAEIVVQ